jgi:endonuclease/exonuclease/phosphatase family metal-dependent hydrolase
VRRKVALLLALLNLVSIAPSASASEPYQVTVMSRNLYLGADVGVALDLIPDFPAAAQFMWDQVKATDFSKRVTKLAGEAALDKPDLIGIQEATTWYCKKNLWSSKVAVFDFLKQFIEATKETKTPYVLAKADGVEAYNPGYSIAAIPYLTKVEDPSVFQSIFGSDSASCGFTIGDAILIREDLASNVIRVGNTEYDATYSIVPTIMTIYRGYTWLDLKVKDSVVRVVSTHLESIWDENKVPNSALQAQQLVSDLANSKMPLIVMGDFNADYRDPRPVNAPNPGEQPVESEACPTSGAAACNAYATMIEAGFTNASPDAKNPKYFSWGASALLNGPDPKRLAQAKIDGNQYGFTDRLDYVFTKNIYASISSKMIGNIYPDGSSIWDCGAEKCFASDHAGVVATIELPRAASSEDPALPDHARFPLGIWHFIAILLVAFISWRIARRISRRFGD